MDIYLGVKSVTNAQGSELCQFPDCLLSLVAGFIKGADSTLSYPSFPKVCACHYQDTSVTAQTSVAIEKHFSMLQFVVLTAF